MGERLHKVLGQIDLGTLDSGERSLPFGLFVGYCKLIYYTIQAVNNKGPDQNAQICLSIGSYNLLCNNPIKLVTDQRIFPALHR